MSDLRGLTARVLGIERPEVGRAAALFLLAFVLGLSLYSFDLALSTSLVMRLDPSQLPWSQVVLAAAVPTAGALLAWLRPRVSVTTFVTAPLAAVALGALGLIVALLDGPPTMFELLGLYAAEHVLSAVALVGFWTVAARTFDAGESRRVYGIISAGELVSGVVGGLVAATLQRTLSLPALLAVAMGGVLAGVLLTVPLARRVDPGANEPRETSPAPEAASAAGQHAAHIGRHGWLTLAYHASSNINYDIVQFLVLVAVQAAHPGDPEGVAGVLGPLLSVRVGLGALLQLFVTSRVLDRRGLTIALVSTPLVVLGVASTAFLVDALSGAVLTAVIVLQVLESATRGGLGKPAFMASQNPMPTGARERTFLLVETAVEPLTTGIAGAALLTLPRAWLGSSALILLPVPGALLWTVVAAALGRSYRRLLAERRA